MPAKKTLKRGSRRQVWNGTAMQTAGGLTKEGLMKNERGRIVSIKKCQTMKKTYKGSDSEDDEIKEPLKEPVKQPVKEIKESKGGFWNTLFE